MPLTRSAARRSHRALASDDVLSTVFSFITPEAGFGAATTDKTFRDAWRRRCRGMLRVCRQQIGEFAYSEDCVAYGGGGGVMVPDLARFQNHGSLQTFSADGTLLSSLNENLNTPVAVALRGDGTAWVILNDENEVVCVRLAELASGGESEVLMRISPNADDGGGPTLWLGSLALAGDSLLVLSTVEDEVEVEEEARYGYSLSPFVHVYDNQTGAFLRKFSLPEEFVDDDSHEESWGDFSGSMAVQGESLYLTNRCSHTVDEYRWRDMTLMRRFGGGDQRLVFDAPFGIAIRGKTLYVSEVEGRQIQVIRLSDDDDSEPDVLQVIPSPDGARLGGLCLSGDRLWCLGPKYPRRELTTREDTYVHLFGPCYE